MRDRYITHLLTAPFVDYYSQPFSWVVNHLFHPNTYSRRKMEDILYDYHLAMAMANNSNTSATQQKAYKLAVMKKYDVTEAQFDNSLKYYIRHTEELHDMYVDISKRLEDQARAEGASESELSQYGTITSKGDTTDIWKGTRSLILSPYAPVNKETFEIKADTAFHKGDRLMLNFDSQFIIQDGMRDAVVVMAVTFTNDSITTQYTHISSDSHQTLMVDGGDSLHIKKHPWLLHDAKGSRAKLPPLRC